MKDEQIIKGLECCTSRTSRNFVTACRGCPFNSTCEGGMTLRKCSLDLIKRQKAELTAVYKIMAKQDEEISDLNKKVASRENLEESFQKTTGEFDKRLEKTVKAEHREAIKEFAKRLKKYFNKYSGAYWPFKGEPKHIPEDIIPDIDKIVKEMTEEEK